jgi:hypothetical protein
MESARIRAEPPASVDRFQPLVQGPVVSGELAYSLFEGGVLGQASWLALARARR